MRLVRTQIIGLAAILCCAMALLQSASAQSTDQNFPTPVSSNEINGTIKARDIGDARLTSYFYAFDGGQGDIFVNVVARNFTGDIDIFTADTLQPLTKMVIYADSSVTETGRLLYLRKGERLILRVEGRSPNDDPATFRIKFGGSFVALSGEKAVDAPAIAKADDNGQPGVRVNSVGTIIAVVPKPTPEKKPKAPPTETVARVEKRTEEVKPEVKDVRTPPAKPKAESKPKKNDREASGETVFENESAKVTVEPAAKAPEKKPKPKSPVKTTRTEPKPKDTEAKATKGETNHATPPTAAETKAPDPMASIWLVIQLKDGNVIRRPMSEVTKFSVDKGVLVVIAKNGKIVRYSLLDVMRVTIE